MLITKNVKSDSHVLKLGNIIIYRVKCVKFLGLPIDENLNWHEHIDSCRSNIYGALYAINIIKHILGTHNMRTVYHSLIYPYLKYGTLLRGCSHSRLFILQKKPTRTVSKSYYNLHTEPLFKKLQILKLKGIHTFQLLIH